MGKEDDSIYRDWVDSCERKLIASSSYVLIVIECHPGSVQLDSLGFIICRPSIQKMRFSLMVQKAQTMADVVDKVDDTMVDLSLAIQNVGVIGEFSNDRLNEVRIAAIYLSAAVMDCQA